MASPRTNFYNTKQYWKRRVSDMDTKVLRHLNAEARGDLQVTLKSYFDLGESLLVLGEYTERLHARAVELQLGLKVREQLRNAANLLEMFSVRLQTVAERKWGNVLSTFPVFKTILSATSSLPSSPHEKAIREVENILDGRKK